MPEPSPLSDVLREVQDAIKSGFALKEPFSLWSQGFLPVPVEALRDPELDRLHLMLLALACRYSMSPAGLHLFASHDYLAGLFGVTKRHIRRVLGKLVRLGYLEVQRRAHGRHNVYLVSDRIPEARRPELRTAAQGLDLDPGAPRDRTCRSSQRSVTGHGGPVGSNKEVCTKELGPSACVSTSPLKRETAKLVKDGMSPRSARAEALRHWREGLDPRYTPEALAKRLRYLGIRAKVARVIAGSCPGSVIVEAAGKLDVETENPAGAFIWHLNRLLERSEPIRGP